MSQAAEVEITGAPSSSGTITISINGVDHEVEIASSDSLTSVASKVADVMQEVTGYKKSQEYEEFTYIWGSSKVSSVSFSDTDGTGTTANTQLLTFFTWRGDEQFTKETEYRTLVTPFENGPEQRRSKQPKRRIFQLPFTQFEDVSVEIRQFFEQRQGRLESFYWQNPDTGEVVQVRFGNDNLSRERDNGIAQRFQIILREIL